MDPDQMEGSQRMEVEGGHKRDEQLVEEGGVAQKAKARKEEYLFLCCMVAWVWRLLVAIGWYRKTWKD